MNDTMQPFRTQPEGEVDLWSQDGEEKRTGYQEWGYDATGHGRLNLSNVFYGNNNSMNYGSFGNMNNSYEYGMRINYPQTRNRYRSSKCGNMEYNDRSVRENRHERYHRRENDSNHNCNSNNNYNYNNIHYRPGSGMEAIGYNELGNGGVYPSTQYNNNNKNGYGYGYQGRIRNNGQRNHRVRNINRNNGSGNNNNNDICVSTGISSASQNDMNKYQCQGQESSHVKIQLSYSRNVDGYQNKQENKQQLIFNKDFVHCEKVNGKMDTYLASFRNNKIGDDYKCCSNQKKEKSFVGFFAQRYTNVTIWRPIIANISLLKKQFHVKMIEANCKQDKRYKTNKKFKNGFCYCIGLIGIKIDKKNLREKVFNLIKEYSNEIKTDTLFRDRKFIEKLKNIGINQTENDITAMYLLFHQRGVWLRYNGIEHEIFDASKDNGRNFGFGWIVNREFCNQIGDTITLKINKNGTNGDTLSFIKNGNVLVGSEKSKSVFKNGHIAIDLKNYYYQYVFTSPGCDCTQYGNYKFELSWS